MFALAIPLWLEIVFFVIGNGASILKLVWEIRKILKDLNSEDKKQVVESCRADLEKFKKDGDKDALLSKIKERADIQRKMIRKV